MWRATRPYEHDRIHHPRVAAARRRRRPGSGDDRLHHRPHRRSAGTRRARRDDHRHRPARGQDGCHRSVGTIQRALPRAGHLYRSLGVAGLQTSRAAERHRRARTNGGAQSEDGRRRTDGDCTSVVGEPGDRHIVDDHRRQHRQRPLEPSSGRATIQRHVVRGAGREHGRHGRRGEPLDFRWKRPGESVRR